MAAPAPSPNTIFIGNLSFQTGSQGLGDFFAKYGSVTSAKVLSEYFRGETRSRGFGFVTFGDEETFNKALAVPSDTLDGREIRISKARPPMKHERKAAFLGNITADVKEENIKEIFPTATSLKILPPRDNRRGYGFANFESEEALFKAIKDVHEVTIAGSKVIVRVARRQVRRFGGRRRFRHAE